MAIFEEVNKGDLKVHSLCNSELDPVANPIRKSSLLRKSEACVSNSTDRHNQCLGKAKPNNQPVLIKGNKTDPVAKPIRKSGPHTLKTANIDSIKSNINEHEECLTEHVPFERGMKIPFEDIQDQCFVAATRSRSKDASEKVPDIFPLQGEHRKPEHVHRPKKDKVLDQPMDRQFEDNLPPIIQPPPPKPRDININQRIGEKQIPAQKPMTVPKEKVAERKGLFQLPKSTPFRVANNMGQTMPSLPQQPMLDFYPKPVRNVPQDPITQHTDQRTKPKVYESLIKPVPVDVQLQGTLAPYDVNKVWEEFDWTPPKNLDQEKKPLFKYIPDYQIFRAHIPKAAELKKFMKQLKSKVIHDYNLPISVKELRAEYPTSPAFKDIYNYVMKGTLHLFGSSARRFKEQCEDFVVMSGVLFKIRYDRLNKGKPSLVLCVPEKYLPTILYQYHDSILAGHPGIVKLYEQLRRKYYFPGLLSIIHQYVKSCIECESTKPKLNEPKIHCP